MLGKYIPRQNSNMQNAKKRVVSPAAQTVNNRENEAEAAVAWTVEEESLIELPLRVRYVKKKDPSVNAHMKLAKMRPKGGLPLAQSNARSLAEVSA